ncbi:helix-turn-helix domain-containing protein [Gracilibacillus pellucidus]|uniref:helix-turn-helix domain-containing protein n=1 Tax=Gracilibacillus pellucidus TaxID=3095368 RepID=UPI0039B6FEB0
MTVILKEVATILFIHRNTVLYRLNKISSILRIDIKNNDDLLRIKMALRFLQMNALKKQSS